MKKLLITAFAVLLASNAYSLGSVSAKVEQIRVDGDGRAMIFFDKPLGGTPAACADKTNYGNALAVDAATDGGKAVLSMVLAAKASGATVTAYGHGVCGLYGSNVVETWNHGFLL
ncbi:hypothetical protein P3339_08340 [Microbulbifer sp. MLAF003]|uniref:hypothetical protein n=1 Tax=unclassified Microbulbifer TaxID=2619833 RepID=UPI0024AD88BF|nr:hypothetical protein [Microbulbifer sp. MLAF003]WHI52757.1 hypothetical protein P3339_08340 [Microbulbifer sp. MLAF003]